MKFDILTIFPDMIYHYTNDSILHLGQKKNLIKIKAHDLRDFTVDKFRRVDDRPYGGGAGMILQVEPIYNCLEKMKLVKNGKKINRTKTRVLIMDPAGKIFKQTTAKKYTKLDRLVLICGRYEGFDERVYKFVDEKISIGEYVLAGGELAALTIVESVARLIPGVLGNENSIVEETFSKEKNKEYPQYTRPESFQGLKVPKILLSGDHQKIAKWRGKKSK
jgi:tRNA (guanine37-N1)-methyltransferase